MDVQSLFFSIISDKECQYDALKELQILFERDEQLFEDEFGHFTCCTEETSKAIFLLRSFGFPTRTWMTPPSGSTNALSLYNAYEIILLAVMRRHVNGISDLARLIASYCLVDSIVIGTGLTID